MLLQIKREQWQCQVTAWAMALEKGVDEVMAEIGHDGSEIIWPELPDPQCRRGHHTQECIAYALTLGERFTPIDRYPRCAAQPGVEPYTITELLGTSCDVHFERLAYNNCGVLLGVTNTGRGHSCAFEYGRVFDPDGFVTDYENINIQPFQLWIRK